MANQTYFNFKSDEEAGATQLNTVGLYAPDGTLSATSGAGSLASFVSGDLMSITTAIGTPDYSLPYPPGTTNVYAFQAKAALGGFYHVKLYDMLGSVNPRSGFTTLAGGGLWLIPPAGHPVSLIIASKA